MFSDIINVTDMPIPLVAADIRKLLRGKHPNKVMQRQFRVERLSLTRALSAEELREDATAAENLQTYYGLEA